MTGCSQAVRGLACLGGDPMTGCSRAVTGCLGGDPMTGLRATHAAGPISQAAVTGAVR